MVKVHSTKRRKTDPETPLKSQMQKGRASDSDLYMPPNRQDVSKLSASEPVTRTSSALFVPTHSRSQPSGSGRRTEKSRRSSSPWLEHKSASGSTSDHDFVLKSLIPKPAMIVDDYDSWEQSVSAEDLKQVQEVSKDHSGMIYHLFFYITKHSYSLYYAGFQNIMDPRVENDPVGEIGGKLGVL
jgi:hypothetical protein